MELDFVEWLSERLPASPHVAIGVGDDAAVVRLGRPELVTTADLLLDGIHFLTSEHTPRRIGRKSLAVNLSDLAAMAAKPVGAVVSLALPRDGVGDLSTRELAAQLMEGMLPLAETFDCPIVGGDTNVTPGPLTIAITAFGEPTDRGVVRRDGAKPGDLLYVTGPLGGSLAGKHLDFTPRVAEALSLHERVDLHAMMDLSDGVSLDLARLCKASGVGAVIEAQSVPITEAASTMAATSGRTALDHALSDGEDFELLFAIDPRSEEDLTTCSDVCESLVRIGCLTEKPGVKLRWENGVTEVLQADGYQHR